MSDQSFDRFSLPSEIPDQVRDGDIGLGGAARAATEGPDARAAEAGGGSSSGPVHRQAEGEREIGDAGCLPHTGFTPERQMRFCDDLAAHGNVRLACRRAGVAPQTAYRAKRREAGFSGCWDAALSLARTHTEAVLAERALEGVEEPVFYHGEEIARRRRFDTRLLLAHLARLDALCAVRSAPASPPDSRPHSPCDFDAMLAQLGGCEDAGLGERADFIAECVEDAVRAVWDGVEDEKAAGLYDDAPWDEAASDRAMVAVCDARGVAEAEGAAEWDAASAALRAWVDEVAGREAAVGVDAVPAALPYEIKSAHPAGRDVLPPEPCHMCHSADCQRDTNLSAGLLCQASAGLAPQNPAIMLAKKHKGEFSMHIFTKATGAKIGAIAAIGMLALAAPAGAQRTGPPAPNNGAPLWGPGVPPVRGAPLLTADLGIGSPSAFTAVVDETTGELCYMLSTPGLMDTTAAHIHLGGPGETGNPVVPLANPVGGSTGGCVAVQADVARAMVANPDGYYVNVHTKSAPNGEVRGQLTGAKT